MDIKDLVEAIPAVELWIDRYLTSHKDSRERLSEAGFPRLPHYFSDQVLNNSYFVTVPTVETPPLEELGLGELEFFGSGGNGGITFKDTFFVTSMSESLHFHELVHVVQWDAMGSEKFLLAYGLGLMRFGYRDSPIERIAYSLQEEFDAGRPLVGIESAIRENCQELVDELG